MVPVVLGEFLEELQVELAATTVRNNFYVLRSVLDYAVMTLRLSTNPALGVALPKIKRSRAQEERRYPLSPGDVARICDALPEPWDTYTGLAAWTGMRPRRSRRSGWPMSTPTRKKSTCGRCWWTSTAFWFASTTPRR